MSRGAPLIDVTDVCRKPTHVSTGACRCDVYKAGTGRHWTGSTRSAEIVQWSPSQRQDGGSDVFTMHSSDCDSATGYGNLR